MIGCLARLARPSHAWTPSLLPFPPNPFRHFAAILLLCSRRRAIGNGRFIARLDFGSAHRGSANNCCPNIVLPSRALHVCFGPERDVAWDYNPQAEATGNHVDTVRALSSVLHDCFLLLTLYHVTFRSIPVTAILYWLLDTCYPRQLSLWRVRLLLLWRSEFLCKVAFGTVAVTPPTCVGLAAYSVGHCHRSAHTSRGAFPLNRFWH